MVSSMCDRCRPMSDSETSVLLSNGWETGTVVEGVVVVVEIGWGSS